MKTPQRLFSIALLATAALFTLSPSSALAHDRDAHRDYDYYRADKLSNHAAEDRYHAERALDRALASGDPRDFYHAMSDFSHARQARENAYEAREHARSYDGYSRGYGHCHSRD